MIKFSKVSALIPIFLEKKGNDLAAETIGKEEAQQNLERGQNVFMKKSVRITLYILSLLTVAGVVWAVFSSNRIKTGMQTQGDKLQANAGAETNDTAENTENPTENRTDTDTEMAAETDTQSLPQEDTVLLFAGDVLITDAFAKKYDTEGITGLVSEELLAAMQDADIFMVNHEFAFSTRGEAMEDKQYTFRTNPKYVQLLLDMGVDIVSLANNHSLDFGQDALSDTMQTLDEAKILHAGAGNSKERAEALQIIEVNGKKFGFLAATRVIPVVAWNIENAQPGLFATYDETRLTERIRESREQCDFLTVYVHWGIERAEYPKQYQRNLAASYFEAGADLVIGAHPHVLQGIELIDGKPVFYSLGNYIFNNKLTNTALAEVTIKADGAVSYRLLPAYASNGKTQFLAGEEAETLCDYLSRISANVKVESDGSLTQTEWKDISYEKMITQTGE